MTRHQPVEYAQAPRAVRAVFDDIMATRRVADVNNVWKYLANNPATLKRTWESLKEVMGPGTINPLVKEMLYLAVSISNGCNYCISSHGTMARARGMTEQMYSELVAIVGMANETNRLVEAYRVPIDAAFNNLPPGVHVAVRRPGDPPPGAARVTVRRGAAQPAAAGPARVVVRRAGAAAQPQAKAATGRTAVRRAPAQPPRAGGGAAPKSARKPKK